MAAKVYSPADVARWFVGSIDRDAGDSITHLKLQKLLYYAQAWALVELGRPLFEEDFQAWAHGPVLESVFGDYKAHGWDAIPAPEKAASDFDEETEEHLGDILSIYGDFSAKHLERMTHKEAPWKDARGDLPPEARSNAIISKDSMYRFYSKLANEVDEQEEE
jgi:uncharacterized phage-associated protein